ncbi:MAG: hypothetical protein AAF558_09325 [Verrucomicrobiota bacterium]
MDTAEQREICNRYRSEFVPSDDQHKLGIALQTLGRMPIYGTRLKAEGGTCGWYVFAGKDSYSKATDFYKPMCVEYLPEYCPLIIPYLGLEPGFKFIIDNNGYEDVWRATHA